MSAFDDAVDDMTDDLLNEAGESYSYVAPQGTAIVTMAMSSPQPFQIDSGNGFVVEVRPVDFKIRTGDLPYGDPVPGHKIKRGSNVYEVHPLANEKCFYQMNGQMTRIHTKLVGT